MKKLALYLTALLLVIGIVTATAQQPEVAPSLKKGKAQPIFIIDGNIYQNQYLTTLDPSGIENINVYKGEKATQLFGEAALHGAVDVSTKDPEKTYQLFLEIWQNEGIEVIVVDGRIFYISQLSKIKREEITNIMSVNKEIASKHFDGKAAKGLLLIRTTSPKKIGKRLNRDK